MKLGLHISSFTWGSGPAELRGKLGEIAKRAEDAGVDRISVMDHVWQIAHLGPPENEMLEAYTTLGWLAAKTERVKLLAMVTAVVYREPGLLAKAVTTLDVLRQHCANEGRDYDTIEKTAQVRYDLGDNGENVNKTIEYLQQIAELGFTQVHGTLLRVAEPGQLDLLAEQVIPAVEKF
jgi:hypothetical protein